MGYIMTLTRLRQEYERAFAEWKARPTMTNALTRDTARRRYVEARMVAADTLDDSNSTYDELEQNPEGWNK